ELAFGLLVHAPRRLIVGIVGAREGFVHGAFVVAARPLEGRLGRCQPAAVAAAVVRGVLQGPAPLGEAVQEALLSFVTELGAGDAVDLLQRLAVARRRLGAGAGSTGAGVRRE